VHAQRAFEHHVKAHAPLARKAQHVDVPHLMHVQHTPPQPRLAEQVAQDIQLLNIE
jgi:hypothetical protein